MVGGYGAVRGRCSKKACDERIRAWQALTHDFPTLSFFLLPGVLFVFLDGIGLEPGPAAELAGFADFVVEREV